MVPFFVIKAPTAADESNGQRPAEQLLPKALVVIA
jgi:hypothetical protein